MARRDYTKHQLAQKLLGKSYSSEQIELILADLIQAGFLNDARYVENYIHYRCARGYGPKRILRELEARGIAKDIVYTQLEEHDALWAEAVRKVWQKRFRGAVPVDFKNRVQQLRFLQNRGFTQHQIETLFRFDAELE